MKKRLFVAIDLSNDARTQVAHHIDSLRERFREANIGWTKPQNLHLTLKFLGNVEIEQEAVIVAGIRDALFDLSAFEIGIAGTGVFPSPGKAKVLWLGVDDAGGGLSLAARRIDEHLARAGFPREGRAFSPHLTIGRFKTDRIDRNVVKAHLTERFGPVVFNVDGVVLYESRPTPSGSVYSPRHNYGLGASK